MAWPTVSQMHELFKQSERVIELQRGGMDLFDVAKKLGITNRRLLFLLDFYYRHKDVVWPKERTSE